MDWNIEQFDIYGTGIKSPSYEGVDWNNSTAKFLPNSVIVTFLRRCGLKPSIETMISFMEGVTFLRRCGLKHMDKEAVNIDAVSPSYEGVDWNLFAQGASLKIIPSHLLTKVWIETSINSSIVILCRVTFLRRCGLKPQKYDGAAPRLVDGHLLTKVWIETGQMLN